MVEPGGSANVTDGTGAAVLAFLDWAGSKGEITLPTAKSYAATVRRVLGMDEALWSRPIEALDIDALLSRFETLNRLEFTTASMRTYKSRFRLAVAMYLAWLANDPAWKTAGKTPVQARAAKGGSGSGGRKAKPAQGAPDGAGSPVGLSGTASGESSVAATLAGGAPPKTVFVLPVRPDGATAQLALPQGTTRAEFKRFTEYLEALMFPPPTKPARAARAAAPNGTSEEPSGPGGEGGGPDAQ